LEPKEGWKHPLLGFNSGKEIDAFWFPANDKIRLEWKLDNGYSSVTEREEFILGANSGWREYIVQALQQHWGLSNDEAR
jgi:hypothetical protein